MLDEPFADVADVAREKAAALVRLCGCAPFSIVITAPGVMPMVEHAGIDPLWFGIFVVLVVEMAQITPPVGVNLYVLQNLSGRDI